MFRFEELNIYNNALDLASWVYNITMKWPRNEMFGMTDQIRRAVVSISLNIAEGSSRGEKDFGHFLDIARGSCYECVAIGKIALNNKILNQADYSQLYTKCEALSKMISALKKSLSG